MTESEWLECTDPTPMLEFIQGKVSDRKLRLFGCGCCRRVWSLFTFPSGRKAVEIAELYADRVASEVERLGAFVEAAREAAGWVNNCATVHHAIGYSTAAAAYVLAQENTVEEEATAAGAGDVVIMANACHHKVEWHGPAMIVALDAASAVGTAVIASLDEEERVAAGEEEDRLDEELQTFAAGSSYATAIGCYQIAAKPFDREEAAEIARKAESKSQCDLLHCIVRNPFRPTTFDSSCLTPIVTNLAQAAYDERVMPSGELDPARLGVLSDALEEAGCQDADILGHLRSPGPHVRGCWAVDLLLGKE